MSFSKNKTVATDYVLDTNTSQQSHKWLIMVAIFKSNMTLELTSENMICCPYLSSLFSFCLFISHASFPYLTLVNACYSFAANAGYDYSVMWQFNFFYALASCSVLSVGFWTSDSEGSSFCSLTNAQRHPSRPLSFKKFEGFEGGILANIHRLLWKHG